MLQQLVGCPSTIFLNLSKRTKSETVRSPPTTSAEQKPSMPPNTHHKGQGNQKDIRSPKDHPKETLTPSYGKHYQNVELGMDFSL